MDFLYHNQFSLLHNTRVGTVTILFYKHELIDWAHIATSGTVALITGNSDDPVTDVGPLPPNVVHWFAGNALISHPRLTCIPLGLENASECRRADHGVVWPRGVERVRLLQQVTEESTSRRKLVLANFSVGTNPAHRRRIADTCRRVSHIDWYDELPMHQFLSKVVDYDAVVCPEGNGKDTHRVWEVLYLRRIPIVFSEELYRTLYHQYPIVLATTCDLEDEACLRDKIRVAATKSFDNLMWNHQWTQLIHKQITEMLTKFTLSHQLGPNAEFATHQPVLLRVLRETTGNVLELGCGNGSTPLIHAFSVKYGRTVVSVDSDASFVNMFSKYKSDLHSFQVSRNWTQTLTECAKRSWDVVLIDHGSWESRAEAFRLLKPVAKYLVLHDCDYFPEHGLLGRSIHKLVDEADRGQRDYSSDVAYSKEYFPIQFKYRTGPPTLLASDTLSCDFDIDFSQDVVDV